MKRLWLAIALLAIVFSATLLNSRYLGSFTAQLTTLLTQAEEKATAGDWVSAAELTREVSERWHTQDKYLYTVLRHADTNEVHIGLREVQEFIRCRDTGEYAAANAQLITKIELLYEMEQLNLQNLL